MENSWKDFRLWKAVELIEQLTLGTNEWFKNRKKQKNIKLNKNLNDDFTVEKWSLMYISDLKTCDTLQI